MTVAEVGKLVEIGKDTATAAAAIAAAIVAALGLQTWKKQLHGSANYELARRLLRATYKVREAIRTVRVPFISIGEIIEARKAVGLEITGAGIESSGENERAAYKIRWDQLSTALIDFQAELLEAEALWGSPIRNSSASLSQCIRELNAAIAEWLHGKTHLDPTRDEHVTGIIYELGDSNPFSERLAAAIGDIESQLRPHLKP